jgi:hypothetical protein
MQLPHTSRAELERGNTLPVSGSSTRSSPMPDASSSNLQCGRRVQHVCASIVVPFAPPYIGARVSDGVSCPYHALQASRVQDASTARSAPGGPSEKKSRCMSMSTGSTLLRVKITYAHCAAVMLTTRMA